MRKIKRNKRELASILLLSMFIYFVNYLFRRVLCLPMTYESFKIILNYLWIYKSLLYNKLSTILLKGLDKTSGELYNIGMTERWNMKQKFVDQSSIDWVNSLLEKREKPHLWIGWGFFIKINKKRR